jgi:hypothetical protein
MKNKQKPDVSDLLIECRLVFTDPLYFMWMYNRLSGKLIRTSRKVAFDQVHLASTASGRSRNRVFAKFGSFSKFRSVGLVKWREISARNGPLLPEMMANEA